MARITCDCGRACLDSSPRQRDEILVFLMIPLPLQEVVIAATGTIGVFVANAGAGFVNRTASRLRVEEHADAAVNLVFLMTQDLLVRGDFREAAARGLDVDAEVFREPVQVPFSDDDALIAATVRGALRAVVREL